jgi:hypothetical protein
MKPATSALISSVKHAIHTHDPATVGGGEFSINELKEILHDLHEYEQLQDAAALLNRIENIESSQATLASIATRTETRLCKLIVHLGGAHLIDPHAR